MCSPTCNTSYREHPPHKPHAWTNTWGNKYRTMTQILNTQAMPEPLLDLPPHLILYAALIYSMHLVSHDEIAQDESIVLDWMGIFGDCAEHDHHEGEFFLNLEQAFLKIADHIPLNIQNISQHSLRCVDVFPALKTDVVDSFIASFQSKKTNSDRADRMVQRQVCILNAESPEYPNSVFTSSHSALKEEQNTIDESAGADNSSQRLYREGLSQQLGQPHFAVIEEDTMKSSYDSISEFATMPTMDGDTRKRDVLAFVVDSFIASFQSKKTNSDRADRMVQRQVCISNAESPEYPNSVFTSSHSSLKEEQNTIDESAGADNSPQRLYREGLSKQLGQRRFAVIEEGTMKRSYDSISEFATMPTVDGDTRQRDLLALIEDLKTKSLGCKWSRYCQYLAEGFISPKPEILPLL